MPVQRALGQPEHRRGFVHRQAGEVAQQDDLGLERVALFERETSAVREHYRALGTPVVAIDAAQAPEAVESDLVGAIRALGDA